jgi:hypothetical protein
MEIFAVFFVAVVVMIQTPFRGGETKLLQTVYGGISKFQTKSGNFFGNFGHKEREGFPPPSCVG